MLRAKRGAAALPGRPGQDRPDRGADAGVRITGDQDHTLGVVGGGDLEPPFAQGPQDKDDPEVDRLGVPQGHAQDLAAAFGRHAGGHHQRPADHPPAHPHVQVRGVDEDVGEPGAVQAAGQELVHALVDVLADPRDRRARDAGLVAQGPHEVVDLAGGDPLDPRGADHGASGPCPPAGGDGAGRGRTTPCEAWGWPVPPRRRWWPPSWASCRCACWCAAGCARSAPRRSRRRPRRRPGPATRPGGRRRKTSS